MWQQALSSWKSSPDETHGDIPNREEENVMKPLKPNLSAVFIVSSLLVGLAFLARSVWFAFTAFPHNRSTPEYALERIAPGEECVIASALNNAGDIVGYSYRTNRGWRAFLWKQGEMITTIDASRNKYVVPDAINETGNIIVGHTHVVGGCDRVFVKHVGASTATPFFDGRKGRICAINASGEMAGFTITEHNRNHQATVWRGSALIKLGTLGGSYSNAFAINDAGSVVGRAEVRLGTTHAFKWRDGIMNSLGTLGGDYSCAFGINRAGSIVGEAAMPNNQGMHAFLYKEGKMTDLGTLGGSGSAANAINDAGQIVGVAMNSRSMDRAFLYDYGVMRDLNFLVSPTPGLVLTEAKGINRRSQILCNGTLHGKPVAFLLTPIPR
jgi:probable HAF family extracellular repeat protein